MTVVLCNIYLYAFPHALPSSDELKSYLTHLIEYEIYIHFIYREFNSDGKISATGIRRTRPSAGPVLGHRNW